MKTLFIISIAFSLNLSAQTVYTTKTGEKYHKTTCRYLKHSKYKVDLKKAIELGYEACKVCKPPTNDKKATSKSSSLTTSNNTNSKSKSSKKSTATQCTGKTKAGKRCKRMTKNANGRCYQH